MVEVGENVYFVDMGTSAVDALFTRGIEIDSVKGVFITHMHTDHTNGLIQFVDLISWKFHTPEPVICLPDLKAVQVIDDWRRINLSSAENKIQYRKVEEGEIFNDGVLKVTAFSTQHCPGSHAYLLEAEGKNVLCTGDLKRPGIDFPEVAAKMPLDLLICESAHFPATEYLPVLEDASIKKICVTHYSYRFLESVLQMKSAFAEKGQNVVIATDNLQFTL